jgi:hypothetical protein
MPKITFDGEIVNAETGEDTTFAGWTAAQVRTQLAKMRDGDALVINAKAEYEWASLRDNAQPPF